MSAFRAFRHSTRLALTVAAAAALLYAVPFLFSVPSSSAQGFGTCADGNVVFAGQACNNIGPVFCPGGGVAGAGLPCGLSSSFTNVANLPVFNTSQICSTGIVISITQSCPNGNVRPARVATLNTGGQYCTLAKGGGQVWVPAGASPADMGCGSSTSS